MSNWDTKFAKKGLTFDDVLLIPFINSSRKSCFAKRS